MNAGTRLGSSARNALSQTDQSMHITSCRVSWYATKLEDLICLCSDCHDLEHGIKQPEPQKSSITRRMRIGKSRFHRFWKDHAKLTKKPKKKYEMVKYSNGSKWLSRSSSGHHAPSKSNGDNFQTVDGRTVFNPK